jgi:glutaminyl-tRNA synthetase
MAVKLIKKGKAYVDELTAEEMRDYRGTLTEPGKNSPWRDRSIGENLELFERMRNCEFPDGSKTLRAKIDMSAPNINMRDPVMYRILHTSHHRTGDKWCIYPMYDFAHGQSDSIEGITHSMCSLEYENHRPLYDWFLDELEIFHPQQIEFSRLNVTHTVMSKRKLRLLVEQGYVDGWTDPRMPTLAAMRRAGYPPKAIRAFIEAVGVAKNDSFVDVELLEHFIRDELNQNARRRMAILRPLKLIIDNYPAEQKEEFWVSDFPQNPDCSTGRMVPFSRELYIEQDDFMENPVPKYFRLSPDREVRLMNAYFVRAVSVEKDAEGQILAVHCTYDPETRGGNAGDGRKVKGTIHWVSAPHAINAEVHLFDYLFKDEHPEDLPEGEVFTDHVNGESLEVLTGCKLEPALSDAKPNQTWQFVRDGYFNPDSFNSKPGNLVFIRTLSLVDTWAKQQAQK